MLKIFPILHDILLGNFPRFSAQRSLKISEQYFAMFFKGYISQTKLNSDAINYVACESLGQAQFYRDHVEERLWELLKLGLIPV